MKFKGVGVSEDWELQPFISENWEPLPFVAMFSWTFHQQDTRSLVSRVGVLLQWESVWVSELINSAQLVLDTSPAELTGDVELEIVFEDNSNYS